MTAQKQPARTTAAYASLSQRFTCQRAEHHLPRTRKRSRRVTRPRRLEGEGSLIPMLSEEPLAALNARSAEAYGSCRDRRLGADRPWSHDISTKRRQEHFRRF